MKLIYLLFFLAFGKQVAAQPIEPCYFDFYQRSRQQNILRAEKAIKASIAGKNITGNQKHANHNPNLKIIPVVIHVIHMGGSENISDAQIQSQIVVLNEDFRKIAGSNGDGNGVDTDIEFCIAKKDPQGQCTDGIIRVNCPLSNHQTYQRSQLKELSYWDNSRYLNMYVVKNINNGNGILGYSSFPGGPPDEDGIVVRHDYFGNIGTASGGLGRTTTHEIGHWFGLYHTFNGGCGADTCTDGDYVCDTPPVANPNYGCPTNTNSCTNDSYPDQIQNYLDYSNDNCKNIFTQGQKDRMQATLSSLRPEIWSSWNIDSTGCDSGFANGPCNVIADFTTLTPEICVGNEVIFYNRSQNNPVSYQWYFQGGNPATSIVANPIVTYSNTGSFEVKLVATSTAGSDSLIFSSYINVVTPPVGQGLPYYEGFETSVFPPNGIIIQNADTGVTWELDNTAVPYQGAGSAKINNLINTNYGQSDAMLLPRFDFTTITGTPYLYFKWAYARSDANYSDELVVLASKDCGATWNQIFYRTGNQLVTGPTQTTPYIPDNTTVWKTASVNMTSYASYSNVQIKIVNVTDGGNNLYIDNIGVGLFPLGVTGLPKGNSTINIYPNPTSNEIFVESNGSQVIKVELINQLGQTMQTRQVDANSARTSFHFNSDLCNGVYFVRIFTLDGGITTTKIVLSR